MPTHTLSTGNVHYTDQGEGAPLVLLHANPGEGQDYAAIIPDLVKHFRVITLDWPGYGLSESFSGQNTADATVFYKALLEFLEKMALPPALFIGNSIGGNVVTRLASEHPDKVKGCVLVSPGGFTPHNPFTHAFCALQGSAFAIRPKWFARLYLRRKNLTTQSMVQRARDVQSTPERLALNKAMWRSFGKSVNDVRALAKNITVPTLLVFGLRDVIVPSFQDGKQAQKCIPHAEKMVMPCGHVAFAEMPEAFLSKALPFLQANV